MLKISYHIIIPKIPYGILHFLIKNFGKCQICERLLKANSSFQSSQSYWSFFKNV